MYVSLIFFFIILIPAVVMPKYIAAGGRSPYRIVLQATLVSTAAIMIVFMIAASSGEGVYGQAQSVVGILSEQAAANSQVSEVLGLADADEDERVAFFTQIYNMGLKQMPASLMFLAVIIAYLEYIFISRLLAKHINAEKMPKFREFSFPHGTAMAIMLMYLAAWLIATGETSFGEMLYVNINMLFDLVFSLQGISVVLMFFYLKRLPGAVGIAAVAVMWITSIGKMFLILLGLVDLMLGLKVRMRGKSVRRS